MRSGRRRVANGSRPARGWFASYLVPVRSVVPVQPAPRNGYRFLLPSVPTLHPADHPSNPIDYTFLFPGACALTVARLRGDAAAMASRNTLGPGGPTPHDLDLYVDGERVATLLKVPSGAANFDLSADLDFRVEAGSTVQFVIPVAPNESGCILNMLFAFAVGS